MIFCLCDENKWSNKIKFCDNSEIVNIFEIFLNEIFIDK